MTSLSCARHCNTSVSHLLDDQWIDRCILRLYSITCSHASFDGDAFCMHAQEEVQPKRVRCPAICRRLRGAPWMTGRQPLQRCVLQQTPPSVWTTSICVALLSCCIRVLHMQTLPTCTVHRPLQALRSSLCRQVSQLTSLPLPPAVSSLHFQPPGWAVPMSMLQPTALADDGTSSVDEEDVALTALRRQWHALLGMEKPSRISKHV